MSASSEEIERDASPSDDEDYAEQDDAPVVESLVEGRQKRSTAGRRMNALLNQEVDDDLELLFAEADEEDVDFKIPTVEGGSDAGANVGGDEDDSSTSDESDQEGDELSGEKQLNKEERNAKRAEKRKVHKAFRKPVASYPKKVKIVEETNTFEVPTLEPQTSSQELTESTKRPKRSDRLSWIPTAGEGPRRTSSRTLSVQNKEKTMASMKESEDRRFRQIAVMEAAQTRKQKEKAPPLTQAEKLAEAVRTERTNKKSLNRWEQLEIERQEKQRAKLEALQNRTLAGPVITFYSGPAEWVDGKLKHVGRRPKIEEIVAKPVIQDVAEADDIVVVNPTTSPGQPSSETTVAKQEDAPPADSTRHMSENKQTNPEEDLAPKSVEISTIVAEPVDISIPDASNEKLENGTVAATLVEPDGLLAGIQYYASLPEISTVADSTQPSSPSAFTIVAQSVPGSTKAGSPRLPEEGVTHVIDLAETPNSPPEATSLTNTTAPDSNTSSATATTNTLNINTIPTPTNNFQSIPSMQIATPPQLTPLTIKERTSPPHVIEHSARNLLILQNYDPSVLKDKDILRRITFGTFHNSKAKLMKTPQTLCAITSQPARYRDPNTGLPYAGLEAYRSIQKLVRGGSRWSNLLGAWVGAPEVGSLGAEVWKVKEKVVEKEVVPEVVAEGDASASVDVKMEGARQASAEASAA